LQLPASAREREGSAPSSHQVDPIQALDIQHHMPIEDLARRHHPCAHDTLRNHAYAPEDEPSRTA
jgi:hypothetical protein